MTKTAEPADPARLRPAGRATRAAIEEAARSLFARRTYDEVSVRAIAAEAGVDPALVIRHFGSKEVLFLRCIDASTGIGPVIEGPVETLGRRLIAYFVDQGHPGVGQRHSALLLASHRPQVREELVRHTRTRFVDAIAPRLEGDDAALRVAMMVAQLGGLLTMLYVQQDPLVTEADPAELIAKYGDSLQRLLDG